MKVQSDHVEDRKVDSRMNTCCPHLVLLSAIINLKSCNLVTYCISPVKILTQNFKLHNRSHQTARQ